MNCIVFATAQIAMALDPPLKRTQPPPASGANWIEDTRRWLREQSPPQPPKTAERRKVSLCAIYHDPNYHYTVGCDQDDTLTALGFFGGDGHQYIGFVCAAVPLPSYSSRQLQYVISINATLTTLETRIG